MPDTAQHHRDGRSPGSAKCQSCALITELEEHHLVPRALGGSKGPTVALCPTCHSLVHKTAKQPSALDAAPNDEARKAIKYMALIIRRAEKAVQGDPNRTALITDRLPATLSRKLSNLASVWGVSRKDAVRMAIEREHSRLFG